MDTTTYDYFWPLASLDAEERQNAANDLITHLHNSYQEFAKSKEKASKINENINDFSGAIEIIDKVSGSDVAYAMFRLTRGLSSPRAGARHGFALALTEVLASFEFFTFKMILPLIDEACPISSSKDKNEADIIFGRVLSFASVIRSGILCRETSSDEDYREVINGLLACANCKPYVRETCYQVIVSSIPLLKKTSFEEKAMSHLLIVMKERSGKSGINNPDDINLAIVIETQYPNIIQNNQWKEIVVNNDDLCIAKWHKPHILHSENLEKLTEAIQVKPGQSAVEIQQNQENRIHSVWDTILRLFISPHDDNPGKQTVTYEKFWKVAVDECLFDDDATHQRKFWGFQLFEKALQLYPEEKIPSLFTPNFMRTLINNSYEKNRYLHEAATRSLKVVEQVAGENQQKALIIVKQLLGQNCDRDFDKVSKTNTVRKILSVVNDRTIEEYVLYLKSIFLQPDETLSSDNDATDQRCQWIINYLYSLLKDFRINRQEGWLRLVLDLFLTYGFYTAKDLFVDDKPNNNKVKTGKSESQNKKLKKRNSKRVRFEDQQNVDNSSNMDYSEKKTSEYILPKLKISEDTQECCRARFFHALGELSTFRSLKSNKTEKHTRTCSGFMSNGQTWAYYAVTLMSKFENDNQLEPLIVLSEEAQQLKKAVIELLQKITDNLDKGSQNSNLNIQQEGFHWLFSYAILTLYTEPEEAMNALQDLQTCFDKMFVQSKKLFKEKKNRENAEKNHDPVDVIVDVLLGFLAKPSAFLHNMAEQAFKVFCDGITKSSLDLMLDLVSKRGNAEEELIDEMDIDDQEEVEDEDEDEDESDDESNENDSDNEKIVNEKNGAKDKSEEDSDEDMSNQDEIMEEFDSKLSEFFKHRKFEKKKKKDAKYQKIHYKYKVIGLLKIFVKEQSSNPLIFELIVPLLEIANNAKTDEIAKSIFDLLNTKIIVIKDGPIEFDDDKVLALLGKVQDMARKARFGDMMKLCWESSAFLFKSIIRRGSRNTSGEIINQHIKKAIAIYESTYRSWCVKSSSLNVKCFSQLPNHIPQIPWHFSEIFLGCTDPTTAKNPKKVMNAYDVSFSIFTIALPKKKRESTNDAISKLVPKIRDTLKSTLQFIAEDLKCGDQAFDSQTLKSVLKFASLVIKRTSMEISTEELKDLWNAKKFLPLLEKIKGLPRFKSSQVISNLVKEITRNFQLVD